MLLNIDLTMLKNGADFYVYSWPEGERCLISSGKGCTIARNQ